VRRYTILLGEKWEAIVSAGLGPMRHMNAIVTPKSAHALA